MKCNNCGRKLRGVFVVSNGIPYCEDCFKSKMELKSDCEDYVDFVTRILQNHKNHLRECKKSDESTLYWLGALDCIENIADKLVVDLE